MPDGKMGILEGGPHDTMKCRVLDALPHMASYELEGRVWHRGLDNNRTQLLTAVYCYQLLVRFNHGQGRENGCICWILDAL